MSFRDEQLAGDRNHPITDTDANLVGDVLKAFVWRNECTTIHSMQLTQRLRDTLADRLSRLSLARSRCALA